MKKDRNNRIISFLFILILGAGLLSYVIIEDRGFSENENRYLSERPSFSLENFVSGKFTEDVEKYADDQMVLRDQLIEIKTSIMTGLGARDINGVYIGKDDYLIEKILDKDFNQEQLDRNLASVSKFIEANRDKDPAVMVVPTSGLILRDKLPKHAGIYDQNKALDQIGKELGQDVFIDTRQSLKENKDQYIYYKTDHHWTSLGAFYGYKDLMESKGLTRNIDSYTRENIAGDFKGSLYSKILNRNSVEDSLEIFRPGEEVAYKVSYEFNKTEGDSVYNMEKLKEKDKYQVFLGGNHSELKIETENKNSKNLLILKDSYANSLIPFLVNDYEKINVLDLRYFNGDLREYMEENQISEILILYNIINFSKDDALEKIF